MSNTGNHLFFYFIVYGSDFYSVRNFIFTLKSFHKSFLQISQKYMFNKKNILKNIFKINVISVDVNN